MNRRELAEVVAFWQPALRLADWDIEALPVARKAMDGDDGECEAYPDLKEATIRVVRGKPSSTLVNHEIIAIHELLHCHFEPIRTEENEQRVEAIIEALSRAFYNLRRSLEG